VAGGKGGVGKSVVAANLAAALAGSGRRCAVIDLDLGGANLHTLLGVPRPRRTLSHLLTGEAASLAELMLQTSIPNLWLVSGNEALLEMANPKHGQKEMLVRHVRALDVDEVLLDLGAGSAFNVLDFFLLARRGLVVVTPEPTALENADHFLGAALYRALQAVARLPDVRPAVQRLRERRRGRPVRSARELIAQLRELDPLAAKLLEERAQAFQPRLLVNQVRRSEERRVGSDLVTAWRERLGVPLACVGSIDADPNVAAAVAQRQPAYQLFPHSRFAREIDALAQRLLREEEPGPRERAEEAGALAFSFGSASSRPSLPALDPAAPGAYLRRCREQRGIPLAEMIERTRIRVLDHIESERYALLPPEPYLRSYLTTYARELGVPDCAGLVASYLARLPQGATAGGAGRPGRP
jgi:flagellar biosynthesis protein FlhG